MVQSALGLTINTERMTIGPSPDKIISNTAGLMLLHELARRAATDPRVTTIPSAFVTQLVAKLGWESFVTTGGDAHTRALWRVYQQAQVRPTINVATAWPSIQYDVGWWTDAGTMRGSRALPGLHGSALRGGRVLIASDASLTRGSGPTKEAWGAFG